MPSCPPADGRIGMARTHGSFRWSKARRSATGRLRPTPLHSFPTTPTSQKLELPDAPNTSTLWTYRTALASNKRLRKQIEVETGLQWYEYSMFDCAQAPITADHHLRRNRHPQPFRSRPRRQGLQADGAGDQAARRGQRGRAPGAARAAQLVGGVFLAAAGLSQQGPPWRRRCGCGRALRDALRDQCQQRGRVPADRPASTVDLAQTLDHLAQELAASSPAALLASSCPDQEPAIEE
jgi:hypothetical protein